MSEIRYLADDSSIIIQTQGKCISMHIFKEVIAVLNTAPCLNLLGCAVECPDVFLNLFNRPKKASVTNSGVQHKCQPQNRSGDHQVLVSSSHRTHWPESEDSFV